MHIWRSYLPLEWNSKNYTFIKSYPLKYTTSFVLFSHKYNFYYFVFLIFLLFCISITVQHCKSLHWTSCLRSFLIIAHHSACIRNPAVGFKPLARPSTPCSPHGSTSAGSTPLTHPHVVSPTFGQLPVNLRLPPTANTGSQSQKALPVDNHSPSFAVPFGPVKSNVSQFQTELRWVFQ